MSIAGYVGAAAQAQAIEVTKSLERLAYRETAASSLRQGAGVVLGAVNESYLWADPESGVIAAWSGSMYEQRDTAHVSGTEADANAAEIAGRLFLRFGKDFPNHIYGEYTVAIWDGWRLLLVRDGMARVPIFYSALGGGVAFASEPRGLLRWSGIDGSISDEAIARSLSLDPKPGFTLYSGIRSFPGGHTLMLQTDREPVAVQHWHPLNRPQLRVKDWREYATALREAMIAAVAVRLPVEGLVASQMSSGFDSSSVSALAAEALARQNRPLVCFTSVPVRATDAKQIVGDRFADEWPLAAKVAAMYPNIEHVAIPTNYGSLWDALDIMADYGAGPSGFIRNARWFMGILQEAKNRGMTTMLEGQAGNLTGSYNGGFGLYDLRRRGQWTALARAARNRYRHGTRWATIARGVWMPGRKTHHLLQKIRRKSAPKLFDLTLMREDFYRSSGLVLKTESSMGSTMEGDRTNGATWRFSLIAQGDVGMMQAMEMRGFGLHREDPTADTRLVELVLSIPDEAFAPGGVRRELYREAFRGHLPAELLAEPLRGLQSSDFLDHFEVDLPEIRQEMERIEASSLAGRYLDLRRMRGILESFHERKSANLAHADQIFNYTFGGALALGRFLRRIEDGENR